MKINSNQSSFLDFQTSLPKDEFSQFVEAAKKAVPLFLVSTIGNLLSQTILIDRFPPEK
jgi:hypothetical protein